MSLLKLKLMLVNFEADLVLEGKCISDLQSGGGTKIGKKEKTTSLNRLEKGTCS